MVGALRGLGRRLGIWGGIAAGVLVGGYIAHRAGANVPLLLDCAAPGLLVAQAIGRVGNWWNQELFGKPTDLPWGLEIDTAHRPDQYLFNETFHPTFLYEALWNLFAAGLLLVLDRRFTFKPPALFALYISLYTAFRFYLETLRIDPSGEFAGLRTNAWVSLVLFIASSTSSSGGSSCATVAGALDSARPTAPTRTMAVPRGRVRRPR